jgi:hypothetical protein
VFSSRMQTVSSTEVEVSFCATQRASLMVSNVAKLPSHVHDGLQSVRLSTQRSVGGVMAVVEQP